MIATHPTPVEVVLKGNTTSYNNNIIFSLCSINFYYTDRWTFGLESDAGRVHQTDLSRGPNSRYRSHTEFSNSFNW